MADLGTLTLAASATVAATGIGALPVVALGARRTARVRAGLAGFAGGSMAVASVVGLLAPGLRSGSLTAVALGAAAGVAFLLVAKRLAGHRPAVLAADGTPISRRWLVVAVVLFVHSLPEGFAIGTAYASATVGLGLFVILAIALQNVPEGTATAMPMQDAGFSGLAQVAAATATSLPQIPGAIAAFLLVDHVRPLLPVSFGFAAGAMLALTVLDLLPEAFAPHGRRLGLAGVLTGGALMVVLAETAGV